MEGNPSKVNELNRNLIALEKRADFFQLVADNTYDWEIFRDHNGQIVYCNQAFERITKYSVEEFVTGKVTEKELIHPEDWDFVFKTIQDALIAHQPVIDLEFRIETKNGEIKTVNLCSQPVFNKNEYAGFRTSIRDITNFKLYQSSLENEKHFRNLYNNISDAVFYINCLNGTIISVNDTTKKRYGYNDEEFVGMPITQIDARDDADDVKMRIQTILLQGELLFETEHITKDKRTFPVEIKTKIIDDKTLLAVVWDITERKLNEKIIAERNKEIELLLKGNRLVLESKDFINTAHQIFDFCREITGAKAGYIALLNENGEENDVVYLEEGGLSCFVDPNLPMPIRGLRSIVYKNGVTAYDNNYQSSEHVRFMPPGHIPLKNVMFAPLKKDGKVVGLLGLGEKPGDFTDEDAKVATSFAELVSVALINSNYIDALKQREEQLQKLNNDKDRFMQILSHDLKSPFNAILGFSELLLNNFRKSKEEEIEFQLRNIYKASTKTYQLLEDILLWSKSQAGNIPFNPKQIIFSEVCNEVIHSIIEPANEKQIKIMSSVADTVINADANMLKTILRNLISNAIKFTNINGCITIKAESRDNSALITVADNGIGIEKEKMASLWQFSEQNTSLGTKGERGSGLGLLLCKEFVETHKGTIWVESEPGKGSEFKFTIPFIEKVV